MRIRSIDNVELLCAVSVVAAKDERCTLVCGYELAILAFTKVYPYYESYGAE
jgi:hypothetical protein